MEITVLACIDKCAGCSNIKTSYETAEQLCLRYANPAGVWTRLGGCPMCTTGKDTGEQKAGFVDPLKASKRKMKGMKR